MRNFDLQGKHTLRERGLVAFAGRYNISRMTGMTYLCIWIIDGNGGICHVLKMIINFAFDVESPRINACPPECVMFT